MSIKELNQALAENKTKVEQLIEKAQSGGNTDELEAIIDNSGVLDSTEGTVEEKVEQVVDMAEDEKLWYNHFKAQGLRNIGGFCNLFENYSGTRLPRIDVSNFESMYQFCYNAKKLERIDFYLDCGKASGQFRFAFANTPNLKYIKGINTSSTQDVRELFLGSGIETIEMPLNFSSVTNATNMGRTFSTCYALKDILFVPETIKVSIAFQSSVLSNESIQSIIDGLATVETAQTLTLPANLKILQSQVDSANAKGWTVAGGTVVSEEEYYG